MKNNNFFKKYVNFLSARLPLRKMYGRVGGECASLPEESLYLYFVIWVEQRHSCARIRREVFGKKVLEAHCPGALRLALDCGTGFR